MSRLPDRPNVWDDVGITLDFDPRRGLERWCVVEMTTGSRVSDFMRFAAACALGRRIAAELREDMARDEARL